MVRMTLGRLTFKLLGRSAAWLAQAKVWSQAISNELPRAAMDWRSTSISTASDLCVMPRQPIADRVELPEFKSA